MLLFNLNILHKLQKINRLFLFLQAFELLQLKKPKFNLFLAASFPKLIFNISKFTTLHSPSPIYPNHCPSTRKSPTNFKKARLPHVAQKEISQDNMCNKCGTRRTQPHLCASYLFLLIATFYTFVRFLFPLFWCSFVRVFGLGETPFRDWTYCTFGIQDGIGGSLGLKFEDLNVIWLSVLFGFICW